MKDTKQIAAECGTDEYTLEQVLNDSLGTSTVMENDLCEMVGALYRRIEKLEEEKECHITEIKALESAVDGNAERIVKLEEKKDRLKETIQAMRTNASGLRNPDAFARPDLQSQRDASAHSMEFWALQLEREAL